MSAVLSDAKLLANALRGGPGCEDCKWCDISEPDELEYARCTLSKFGCTTERSHKYVQLQGHCGPSGRNFEERT